MALYEQDREDLMSEATALYPRAELEVDHETSHIFWGQKKNGHFSFYFGSDPVYQFDQSGLLRRAFIDGQLYRTQGSTLARLSRERTASETVLKRHDLTRIELESCLQTMKNRFQNLEMAFSNDKSGILSDFLFDKSAIELQDLIHTQIKQLLQQSDQLAPRIRGKR